METKKLISELTDYIEASNLKNSQVEKEIGLPKNSLSNFLSFKKQLPEKWVNPISEYMKVPDEKSKVEISSKKEDEPKPFSEGGTMGDQMIIDSKKEKWVKEIETFCSQQGIVPSELIESYKSKKVIKKEMDLGNEQVNEIAHNFYSETPRYRIVNGKKIFK
jgi:hypothetical protein